MKSGGGATLMWDPGWWGRVLFRNSESPWSHRSGALGKGSLGARQGQGHHVPSLCQAPFLGRGARREESCCWGTERT